MNKGTSERTRNEEAVTKRVRKSQRGGQSIRMTTKRYSPRMLTTVEVGKRVGARTHTNPKAFSIFLSTLSALIQTTSAGIEGGTEMMNTIRMMTMMVPLVLVTIQRT